MTLHEESQWGLIRPVELVGVKDSGRSLLNIRFRGLSEGSPKIGEDNTTTFVELKMSQININLMMQPIMRILDFTLS
jgi:vacuolar protein sorting-associated protein 13A/C